MSTLFLQGLDRRLFLAYAWRLLEPEGGRVRTRRRLDALLYAWRPSGLFRRSGTSHEIRDLLRGKPTFLDICPPFPHFLFLFTVSGCLPLEHHLCSSRDYTAAPLAQVCEGLVLAYFFRWLSSSLVRGFEASWFIMKHETSLRNVAVARLRTNF